MKKIDLNKSFKSDFTRTLSSKVSGFTLIELLVVVAIISLLASVILASLNTARAKGANAAIKANLANIRAQAEIVYDATTPNEYGSTSSTSGETNCSVLVGETGTSNLFSNTTIKPIIYATVKAAGNVGGYCKSTTQAWVVSFPLKPGDSAGAYWCSDSTGASKGRSTVLTSALAC